MLVLDNSPKAICEQGIYSFVFFAEIVRKFWQFREEDLTAAEQIPHPRVWSVNRKGVVLCFGFGMTRCWRGEGQCWQRESEDLKIRRRG